VAQTFASTLLPTELNACVPLLCTVCNKLFKKFCSEAFEDWFDAVFDPADVPAAVPAVPLVPCISVLNDALKSAVAEFDVAADPVDPSC
jgi:hypothetical protein